MRAEEIFYKNVKHIIRAEVMCNENKDGIKIFKGKLLDVDGNKFIIENEFKLREMFRYESVISLSVAEVTVLERRG